MSSLGLADSAVLLRKEIILTMDRGHAVYPKDDVLVVGDTFKAAGFNLADPNRKAQKVVIDHG